MAEAPRTPGPASPPTLPDGFVEELVARPPAEIRPSEVARARRRAEARAFDDGEVVEEIASQLLQLSSSA